MVATPLINQPSFFFFYHALSQLQLWSLKGRVREATAPILGPSHIPD